MRREEKMVLFTRIKGLLVAGRVTMATRWQSDS